MEIFIIILRIVGIIANLGMVLALGMILYHLSRR